MQAFHLRGKHRHLRQILHYVFRLGVSLLRLL